MTRQSPHAQFFYEYFENKSDGTKQWYRCYGLEVSGVPYYVAFSLVPALTEMSHRTGRLPRTVS